MKPEIIKVNGIAIECPYENEQHWVAVKPICQALGIDHPSQFKRIKEDELLGQLCSESLYSWGADNKQRKMFCLPAKYIFGWIFSIDSTKVSERAKHTFMQYKLECYNALYEHFMGSAQARLKLLASKIETEEEITRVEEELLQTEKGKELQSLKVKLSESRKELNRLDKEAITGQLTMFNDKKE